MTPFKVFDLNDWELSAHSGELLEVQMPGFALVEPKVLILGEQALREHRRSPLAAHYNYWHRLDASPLRSRHRSVRSSADLVFNQLVQLIEKGGAQGATAIFTVPSHYSKDQLALLLGIVEETSVTPLAFVDASVAAGAAEPADWVLDVTLQQMTLTRLEQQSGKVTRDVVESMPEGGLLPLLEAWLARIADEFVHETRFDPLRIADTEQQLWSRLYDWVGGKCEAQSNGLHLEVKHQAGNWHVNFDVRELEQTATKLASEIASVCGSAPGARFAVTHRAARIPGLLRALEALGINNCQALTPNAHIQGISANTGLFAAHSDGGVKFVTSLTARHTPPTSNGTHTDRPNGRPNGTHTDARPLEPAPTHLVHEGIATPISAPVDLARVVPTLPANTYQIARVTDALEISEGGQCLHRLTCGHSATIGTHTLLAVRITDHGA